MELQKKLYRTTSKVQWDFGQNSNNAWGPMEFHVTFVLHPSSLGLHVTLNFSQKNYMELSGIPLNFTNMNKFDIQKTYFPLWC